MYPHTNLRTQELILVWFFAVLFAVSMGYMLYLIVMSAKEVKHLNFVPRIVHRSVIQGRLLSDEFTLDEVRGVNVGNDTNGRKGD